MTKQKHTNLTIGAVVALIFLLLYNVSTFAYSCQTIRDDVIRLHIIANSDSDADQQLKLKVRDAVLAECPDIFDGSITPEDAKAKITPEIENLTQIAQTVITENGYNYSVKVTLETEYFATRVYDDSVTLPAGKYLALKIVIGEGVGKNWWCVMFPSLCLPAAEETDTDKLNGIFSKNQKSIVLESEKYEVRFKIVEYAEMLKDYLSKDK
ncbi:MAG: stage II sporulation protein R [Clostridia bacterium]|nr:stage II sporulation protein R [Clostridia bacterium]